jgi:hypothetical protein
MSKVSYYEVIWWPLRVWLLFMFLDLALIISIGVALSDFQILIFTLMLFFATALLAYQTRLVISFDGNLLRVGRAKLERKYMGEISKLSESEMKLARGAPNNYLAIRFWVRDGVKIALNDSRDPNKNWVISSRKSEELKETLTN